MVSGKPDPDAVRVTGIDLQTRELERMINGVPVALEGTLVPAEASIQRVKITSSDPEVAKVTGSGAIGDFRVQGVPRSPIVCWKEATSPTWGNSKVFRRLCRGKEE